ncbi:Non-specific serine/threonine protein kinase protein [Dioscorea alata]|uniref:Non-specific serine/threonine protein kinase protein n=1 Tax=Dioscorea alata TaxID=55571 RepID=A0ACB7V0I5_DIOAL|nr:Non-specific serine/threonine protein kinase protein [Dioscorea alata]
MGCCFTTAHQPQNPDSDNDEHHHNAPDTNVNPAEVMALSQDGWNNITEQHQEGTAPFRQYTLQELMAATDGFTFQNFLSKGGGEITNNTYRGRLPGGQRIAVKRFTLLAWPDEAQFREMAIRGGRLRHRRLVNLIGYCCDADERLLVAEYMPNHSLATHLSNSRYMTMEWSMRLRVACYIAEALEYCINEARTLYFDLNPNKVLLDEAGSPCLSCFGLAKNHRKGGCYRTNISYTPPECIAGMVTPESMIYSFGILLQDLLSGKQIPQDEALELVLGKKICIILDSRLNLQYSIEEATVLMKLAYQCLEHNPTDRPTIGDVIATLAQVQNNAGGPSNAISGTEVQDA